MQEKELTNNIVAILVTNQGLKWTFALVVQHSQSSDDLTPLVGSPKLYALLHDVTGKFVF